MPITNRRNTKKKAALEAVSEFNSNDLLRCTDAMDKGISFTGGSMEPV